jgi:hypothetical protein
MTHANIRQWWLQPEHEHRRCTELRKEDGLRCKGLAVHTSFCRRHLRLKGMLKICMSCARCNRMIKQGDLEWQSSLYGSKHILCEKCGQKEEEAVESAGSNEIPELLAKYGEPNE